MSKDDKRSYIRDFSELPLFRQSTESPEAPLTSNRVNVVKLNSYRKSSDQTSSISSCSYLDQYLKFAEKLDW